MNYILPTQHTIRVRVDYYDALEREKFQKYPSAEQINSIASTIIDVPTAEFLTYYLFHLKRLGDPHFASYKDISRELEIAVTDLHRRVHFNGVSISIPDSVQSPSDVATERIGEAVALSVVNRIEGLTEADWSPIPTVSGRNISKKTFDYALASNGERFVQVECKGSATVSDANNYKTSSVSIHKSSIIKKKEQVRRTDGKASLLYGAISVIDNRHDSVVQCWLVDPPSRDFDEVPQKYRLLQRMKFLRDWITFISPRSQFSSAIATRINDLESLHDPFELNGVPLLRNAKDPFEFRPVHTDRPHSRFLATRSRIVDGPAGGVVLQISKTALMLLGIREELCNLAAKQNLKNILEYSGRIGSIQKTVECVFSRRRYNSLVLPESVKHIATRNGAYHRFKLPGQIHYSAGGLVFGVLPLPEE
ncbi:MAG: hypothetical protein PHW63_11095 [Alphaproteobacteria bacterium]|nr:hypothetical protein [Alphaproteobacteria bacterium]